MTDNHFRGIPSPSPSARQGPSVLPPLSKFYYGPAQGWNSAEASPSQNGSTWSLHSAHHEITPSVHPQLSPGLPAYSSSQWQNQFPRTQGESQGWQSQSHSPVNPGWDSRPTSSSMDTSTWGVNYKRVQTEYQDRSSKPPLPPRPIHPTEEDQQQDQYSKQYSPHSKYSSHHPSARGSATTIDVPLFLQPQIFDSESAPPLPRRPSPPQAPPSPVYTPPQPSRQPPPPPKLPLDHEDSGTQTSQAQEPTYDPQKSNNGGHYKQSSRNSVGSIGSLKRPRFDPQNSIDGSGNSKGNGNKNNSWQDEDQRPSIPTPQFSTFDVRAALPKSLDQDVPDTKFGPTDRLQLDSVSPIHDSDRMMFLSNTATRWDPPAAQKTSPERQHAILQQQDRRSTSATDASSNRPATSTPESQQTSNTSYRESETQAEPSRQEGESNGSFYWHSGRSSSEGEDERSQETKTATPGVSRTTTQSMVDHNAKGLPTRSTSLSPIAPITYGASALGFGGPSDWEYFGDYEAEEIDDEDLYAHKPRAELPAEYSQSKGFGLIEGRRLSKEENPAGGNSSLPEENTLSTHSQTRHPPDHVAENGTILESKWSPSTTTPTTPYANSSRPLTVTSEPLPTEDQRPDLDEVIRAWSDAPHIGRSSSAHSSGKLSQRHFHRDYNPAEASLASTPGENVLGIYAIPKDAPPMPKLPQTIDRESIAGQNGPDELQQALECYVNADKGKIEMVDDPSQDPGDERGVDRQKSQALQDGILAFDSRIKVEEFKTREADGSDQTFEHDYKSDEPSNTSQEETHGVPKCPSNVREEVKASAKTFQASALALQSSTSQGERRTDVSQVSDEAVDIDEEESDDVENVSHHHGAMVNAHPTLIDHSEKSHQSQFSATTGTSSDQKRAGSPLIDPRPSMDIPPIPVGIPGTRTDRNSPAGSDFARKRSMFESPSDKKVPSSPFLRKPLKEVKQPAELTIVTHDRDTALASKPKVQYEYADQVETLSHTPEDNRPVTETVLAKDYSETAECHNVAIETGSSKPGRGPQQAIIHTKLPEDVETSSGGDPKHAETHDSTVDSDKRFSKHDPDLQGSRIMTSGLNESPVKIDKDRAKRGSRASIDEQLVSEEQLDQVVTKNTLAKYNEDAQIPKDGGSSFGQDAQARLPSGPISEPSNIDLRFVKSAEPLSECVPSEEKRSSKVGDFNDPYADLDPWGRASLNRFAAMLREEARVESNKDKLNIFNVFASRESRLRVVLYGTDDELILPQKSTDVPTAEPQRAPSQKHRLQHLGKASSLKKAIQQNKTAKIQQSAKELPPLPPNRDSLIIPPTSKLTPLIVESDPKQATSEASACNPSDSPQYSPGGRPIIQHLPRMSIDIDGEQGDSSIGMKSEDDRRNTALQADRVEELSCSGAAASEQVIAHARPRVHEGGSEVKNYLTNRRSVYRPFAAQTMESLENAITFGHESSSKAEDPPVPALFAPTSQYNSTLPSGNIVNESAIGSDKTKEPASGLPLDLRRFVDADFDPLVMVLPESEVVLEDSTQLTDLKIMMDAVPDDFSFIHASVVAWDANVKNQREDNERQRHARQIESEQRIDALFDDHEIGYGDIAELEGEFKQSEAVRKAEEDRSEYQTFVEDVFNLVWTRLHYELDQLIPHYEQYSKLMNETLAGKEMFDLGKDGLALAPTMTAFLGLHQKLEIRYQKAFEAVLERDRRLKKTEISPWYTLSNIVKVKQLEKQFEDAEKNAIIEYCQQRDKRANKLMDVLDQNTLRGVGSNQDYMEAVMKAVRRIASGRAFASVPSSDGPKGGIELVQKAKTITNLLASSSEQIVQTFHVADMLLNSADYEVSVAKAKIARADMATLAKLKEERAKEDQKLMRDLEHRLALIREDSRRTNDEIIKLMLFLGVQNGRAIHAHPVPPALGVEQAQSTAGAKDPDHDVRAQQALDPAMTRSAEHNGSG